MSYALPSMTRCPPRRRASRSRTSSSRARRGARRPRCANVGLVVAGSFLIYLTAQIAIPSRGQPGRRSRSRTSACWSSAAASACDGAASAALLYLALGSSGCHSRGAQGRGQVCSARPAATSSDRARRGAGRPARGAGLGSADRRGDRRHGARDADDLRGRRAVARGDERGCRWARPSRTAGAVPRRRHREAPGGRCGLPGGLVGRRPASERALTADRDERETARPASSSIPNAPGSAAPLRPGGSTARRRCSSAPVRGPCSSRSPTRWSPRASTGTGTSVRTRGHGWRGRCARSSGSCTGRGPQHRRRSAAERAPSRGRWPGPRGGRGRAFGAA